jgi:hypothetical protein
MQYITYLKKVPVLKQIFGYALMAFGLIFLLENIITAIIIATIGVYLVSTEGSQVDFIRKRYRTVWSVAGLHIGTWKPCPEFDYVSVFSTKESQTVNARGASTTITSSVILVNLFFGNKHLTFYKATNKDEAFKVAQHFRMVFNLDILDATESEKKWVYGDTLI